MNKNQILAKYNSLGLETEYGLDKPGKVYPPHRHEKTFLYTLGGSIKIKIDNKEWMELEKGEEFIVGSNQLHEAIVGKDGWEYVAAWDKEEAKRFSHQKRRAERIILPLI